MDILRYILALLVVVCVPPGVALWLVIHPLAGFWRRLGPGWTYAILSVPTLGAMAALFLARRITLGADLGTNWWLIALAIPCAVFWIAVAIQRRRRLTFRVLAGWPELLRDQPGVLLTDGIYATMRHPRYVEVVLGTAAYCLVANYVGAYIVLAASIAMLYVVVVLEERELRRRFGEAYDAYAQRVPRFIPRYSRGAATKKTPDDDGQIVN
jgi:protein-S-isoprenylcysteine O-methyltransferase Ste14